MINEKEINLFYKVVYDQITQISFGPIIYSDQRLLQALPIAFRLMKDEIVSKKYDDISIRIVPDVVYKVLNENINRLKKEDERRLCFEVAFIMLFNFLRKAENSRYV